MDHINGINSTSEMRRSNCSSVYRMIYKEQQISKQEIANKLNMSLPTVSQYEKELTDAGLIEKCGYYNSTGGRKPYIIQVISTVRVAAGLEIRNDIARLNLIDLYGSLLKEHIYTIPFAKTSEYYDGLCSWVNDSLAAAGFKREQVLGIGIGIQGLISPDGQEAVFGKLLPAGILISDFTSRLNYPCVMIHDVELAALAALWYHPNLKNVIYISLNPNLGGALIMNGDIHTGQYPSGIIEHMQYIPNGLPCYCGKNGCLESYCSAKALEKAAREPLEQFFFNLRLGRKYEIDVWEKYLHDLAAAIDNVRMIFRADILIGGLLQHYMVAEDYEKLCDYVFERTFFKVSDLSIIPSKVGQQATANGGAIYFIKKFLDTI